MSRKPPFLRRGLLAALLAAPLAGCGGGGGGGGGGASTSPPAAAPSAGSVQQKSAPGGEVHAASSGGPYATAPTAVIPRIERYTVLYEGALARHRTFQKFKNEQPINRDLHELSELWIDIETSGKIIGYWRIKPQSPLEKIPRMAFLEGQIAHRNKHWTAILYTGRGKENGKFELMPSPEGATGPLIAHFKDEEEFSRETLADMRPIKDEPWAGKLTHVVDLGKLPDHNATVSDLDTTFKAASWIHEGCYKEAERNLFNAPMSLTRLDQNQWMLRNATGAQIRIEANLRRSETTGACTATMNFSTRGRTLNDIAGRCFVRGPIFTLYSTDRAVQLWMTGTLGQP